MPVTASAATPEELSALQALLDRSARTATPAVADSVAYPARRMSAAEFVEDPHRRTPPFFVSVERSMVAG